MKLFNRIFQYILQYTRSRPWIALSHRRKNKTNQLYIYTLLNASNGGPCSRWFTPHKERSCRKLSSLIDRIKAQMAVFRFFALCLLRYHTTYHRDILFSFVFPLCFNDFHFTNQSSRVVYVLSNPLRQPPPMEFHRDIRIFSYGELSKFDNSFVRDCVFNAVWNACFVRTRATFFSWRPSSSPFSLSELLIRIQRYPSSHWVRIEKVAKLSILDAKRC